MIRVNYRLLAEDVETLRLAGDLPMRAVANQTGISIATISRFIRHGGIPGHEQATLGTELFLTLCDWTGHPADRYTTRT